MINGGDGYDYSFGAAQTGSSVEAFGGYDDCNSALTSAHMGFALAVME